MLEYVCLPHKRSLGSMMRRAVRGYVSEMSYRDVGLGESVNRLGEGELNRFMRDRFGVVDQRLSVFGFKQGEVLSSPRGDGSLQRIDEE